VENEIQSAEAALAALEDELSDPAAWSTPERSAESAKRHEAAKKMIEQLYKELETLEA
jgi:ATP-binding cassette subfamily F protein 3